MVALRGPSPALRVGALLGSSEEEKEAPGGGERGPAVESHWGPVGRGSAVVVLARSFPLTETVEIDGCGEEEVAWRGRGGEGRGGEGGRWEDEVDGVGALLELGLEEKKEVDPRRGEVPKLFARRRNARGPLVLRMVGAGAGVGAAPCSPPLPASPFKTFPDRPSSPDPAQRVAPSPGSANDSLGLRGVCPHSSPLSRTTSPATSSSPGVGGRLNNPSPACINARAEVVRARGR